MDKRHTDWAKARKLRGWAHSRGLHWRGATSIVPVQEAQGGWALTHLHGAAGLAGCLLSRVPQAVIQLRRGCLQLGVRLGSSDGDNWSDSRGGIAVTSHNGVDGSWGYFCCWSSSSSAVPGLPSSHWDPAWRQVQSVSMLRRPQFPTTVLINTSSYLGALTWYPVSCSSKLRYWYILIFIGPICKHAGGYFHPFILQEEVQGKNRKDNFSHHVFYYPTFLSE